MNSENTWPGGYRHAMHQSQHEDWNSSHYPGTRQLCSICDEPTGRCEEDTIWSKDERAICEECGRKQLQAALAHKEPSE